MIVFSEFFERLKSATGIRSQMDLSSSLGVHRSAVTQAKKRNAVPQKWILLLARRFSLSADWLEFGAGPMRPIASPSDGSHKPDAASQTRLNKETRPAILESGRQAGSVIMNVDPGRRADEEVVYVPKVAARLCAGGGSFEAEAAPVSSHPFPRWWLAKMGSPSAMVFMDVVGDSMEPGICDGDTVLVDQSWTRLDSHSVLAVGVDEAIYLKRAERCGDGILLHSDNPRYVPMEIFGDELENFRVIGRVVWLCRDCR